MSVRVLMVDDNYIARVGIRTIIETDPGLEVVAEADNGADAIALWRQHQPDMALVDLRMPGLDGIDVTTALVAEHPSAQVLILTNHSGEENVFQAIKAGARGFLNKDTKGDQLLEAIRTVASGKRYLPPGLANKFTERALRPSLSGRERQVLKELYAGRSNQDIADALGLTQNTVAMYVRNILSKLEVKTRTEAVRVAIDRGILIP